MSDSLSAASPSGPGNPADGDQYREYYIPANIVKEEHELLEEYETDRLAHVLGEIYNDFYLMIELMRGYAEGKDDEDFTYWAAGSKTPAAIGQVEQSIFINCRLEISHEKNHRG